MRRANGRGRPLWKCPKCRQRFVTRNLWHSCVRLTVAEFFRDKPDLKVLYGEFLRFVRQVGPVTVNVNKTRISFQGRVRFAGVVRTKKNALICGFWLKRRILDRRLSRIEFIPPNNYVYEFELKDPKGLDEQVREWLEEAYEVGAQRATDMG
jgi:hypothetical protein